MVTTMRTSVVTRTKFSTNLDLLFMGVLIVQFIIIIIIIIILTGSCIQIWICMPGDSGSDCHNLVRGKRSWTFVYICMV
jgi:hypothetical protein